VNLAISLHSAANVTNFSEGFIGHSLCVSTDGSPPLPEPYHSQNTARAFIPSKNRDVEFKRSGCEPGNWGGLIVRQRTNVIAQMPIRFHDPWLTKEKPPRRLMPLTGSNRTDCALAICASHPILVRYGSA
jgi:hypothetical protein